MIGRIWRALEALEKSILRLAGNFDLASEEIEQRQRATLAPAVNELDEAPTRRGRAK